jgi:hypothetical protein
VNKLETEETNVTCPYCDAECRVINSKFIRCSECEFGKYYNIPFKEVQRLYEREHFVENLTKRINKDTEWHREYILHNEDFVEENYMVINYEIFHRWENILDLIGEELGLVLTQDQSHFLLDCISDGDIEIKGGVNLDGGENQMYMFGIPIGEQEIQLSDDIIDDLDKLTKKEFDEVTENADAYIGDIKGLAYLIFGCDDCIDWYLNIDDLKLYLKMQELDIYDKDTVRTLMALN